MFRYDLYCRNCDYEKEVILKHSSDVKNCPECGSRLEKAAGGCNISLSPSKIRPKDVAKEISTPLGRFEHADGFEFEGKHVAGRVDIYHQRNARLGDPEMN